MEREPPESERHIFAGQRGPRAVHYRLDALFGFAVLLAGLCRRHFVDSANFFT